MPRTWSIRLQTGLVVALFLGSLATVLFSAFQTLLLPQREVAVRDRLQTAGRRMAEEAGPELASLPGGGGPRLDALNDRLRVVSARALADFPGVEGGFYLDAGLDRFAGYGFPTDQPGGPPPERGDGPPSKEVPFVLLQARQSLSLDPGEFQVDVRTIGPSRVAVVTGPVGPDRHARAAVWALYRLTRPETLEAELRRYQVSTGLALGGIALAVVLTANLARTLRDQRLAQERLRDDLRRAEHLAALGKLLAGVAHEVRNPLAGIRSTVQLWERLPETAQDPDSRAAVIGAVDRLNEIVGRLLYFARADNAERQPVSVNAVLAETLNLLEAQAAGQSVTIERDLDPNLPSVSGSASALRQVFLNLATNALQAMPQGGRLRCSTRHEARPRTVEVRFADTGPGIPAEDRKHLFEPFFTTRPEGTGLGLALCREIVLQHGGRIELEAADTGTTFRVTIPPTHSG